MDNELKSEFKEKIRDLETDAVSVSVRTYRTNQGNESGQDVTLRFPASEQMDAIDVVNDVVQLGKEYYDRQLERNLGRDDHRAESARKNQQRYFDDEAVKEFCLLYRGAVDF